MLTIAAFKTFPRIWSNDAILNQLRKCQRSLHKWGRANNITVDAGKEEFMIISTVEPLGGHIKMLGIEFDGKLVMHSAAHKCAVKASWKMKSLLRARRFYSITDLIMLYKSHVLSFVFFFVYKPNKTTRTKQG